MTIKVTKYLLLILAFCLSPKAFAQVDTEFWFAVPYLVNAHDQSLVDGNGQLCITTFADTAHVVLTQPALTNTADPRYLAPRRLTINPHTSLDIPVANGSLNRAAQSGLSDYGLHLESDAHVTVYFAQVNQNSEVYTYKGRNALGTSFVVPMQRQHANAHSASSSIEIVASENNTQVTISTPVTTQTNPSATTWTVTLQAGQVYSIYAKTSSVGDHLGGTVITSDKPVAVNSTDDSVASSGQDLMGEQLVPQDLAGSEYIALKNNSTDERLYLYTFPGQPISYSLNGGAAQTLAGGSNTMIQLTAAVNYLSADAPFVCFQMTGDGGELGGTVLPRLDCTGSKEVAIRRRFSTQKLGLLVKSNHTNSFRVNGVPYTFTFSPVPGKPEWSYATSTGTGLFDTNGIAHISNDSAIFHCSILDYGGGTCSYGYFSGYNQVAMAPVADKEVYVVGETIHLSLADSVIFKDVEWTYPDGSVHAGYSQHVLTTSAAQGGYYTVTGTSSDGCLLSEDTYRIMLHVVTTVGRDTTVCISEEYPASTTILYDSLHMGQNVLLDTLPTPQSAPISGMNTLWEERVSVRAGQQYQFFMNYASATTSRNMTVNVLADNVPFATQTQRTTTTAKPLSGTYVATQTGRVTLRVEAGQSTTATSVTLSGLSFRPMVTVQDTLHVIAIDCSEPEPHPCPEVQHDTTHIEQYCDTLLPYTWRTQTITSSGIYRDTIRTVGTYDDGPCDSIIYVLEFSTIHCEREPEPEPHPCPEVQHDTTHIEQYCDTLLPYTWRTQTITSSGIYRDTIRTVGTYDDGPCDSIIYVLEFSTVHCEREPDPGPEPETCVDGLIAQRWNDVLTLLNAEHNGGYEIVSWRWYRNGIALPDDTDSYIYFPDLLILGDEYVVEITTLQGETLRSCPFVIEPSKQPTPSMPTVNKVVENNRIYILRDNHRYTPQGQLVK